MKIKYFKNKYIITYEKEILTDEPLYSVNKKGKAYISGYVKVTKNIMFNKVECGITDIEDFIQKKLRTNPNLTVITWKPYTELTM